MPPRSARSAHSLRIVRVFIFGATLACATSVATPSHADETSARVEELKQRGNQAMSDLRTTEALEAYRAALALAPNDATLQYNLGRAHQALGQYPEALDAFRSFADHASPDVRARVPKLAELLEDVRLRVATLSIRCSAEAPSASIRVDAKIAAQGCGTTPRDVRISVPQRVAEMEIRFTDERFQAQARTTKVEGGGAPVTVAFDLLPVSSSGTLRVRVTPVHARIAVDGVERGNTPLEVPLAAGSHALDIRADGYSTSHTTVPIEAGATRDVAIDLGRSAPITTKWWFWTGVAVAAAGVALAIWYVAAEPESDPSRGSIAPGQITAPTSAAFRF